MRILVIEDEAITAMVILGALRQAQHLVDVAHDGLSGEELALVNDYDVILLDLMLPDTDGRELCRTLRKRKIVTPILMLTGLTAVEDKVQGLDAGADDYLIKPFNIEELLARVRSLGRRRSELKSSEVQVRDLVIDMARRTVTRGGRPLQLSAKRFALLEYFIMNPGRVLTREMIGDHIWDMNFDPRSNVIDTLVRRLRDDIDKDAEFPLIHTVRGVGYRFSEGE
jgi:DNA-binding response OmpR family regulator